MTRIDTDKKCGDTQGCAWAGQVGVAFSNPFTNKPAQNPELPTFRGGEILVSAENLKEEIYSDEPV